MSQRSRAPELVPAILFAAASLLRGEAMPEGRLMPFPDIQKDRVVFSYGGDLWLVLPAYPRQ